MRVDELRKKLEGLDEDIEVYFRVSYCERKKCDNVIIINFTGEDIVLLD